MKTKTIKNQTINIYESIDEIPSSINVVAAYQRKTKFRNESEKFSIESQICECENFCANSGHYHLIHFTEETQVSGETLDRPALNQLISAIESKKIYLVLVRDVDRLYRNPIVLDFIRNIFIKYNVDLQTFTEKLDLKSPNGVFIANVKASVGKFEVDTTGARIRLNRKTNAEKGFTPYGFAPFGYISRSMLKKQFEFEGLDENEAWCRAITEIPDKKIYKVNPTESEIIHIIFDKATDPNPKKRCGARRLATFLNDNGYKTRENCLWRANKIRIILSNPFYMGYTIYDEDAFKNHSNKKKEKQYQTRFKGNHDPIISESQWNKAQEYRIQNRNKTRTSKKTKNYYGLRNILKCKCGDEYVGKTCNEERKYYLCRRKRTFGKKYCSSSNFNKNILETSVIEAILKKLNNKSLIVAIFNKITKLNNTLKTNNTINYKHLLQKLEREITLYHNKYVESNDEISQDIAWDKLKELHSEKKLLLRREQESQSDSKKIYDISENKIKQFVKSLREYFCNNSIYMHEFFQLLSKYHDFKINVIKDDTVEIDLKLNSTYQHESNLSQEIKK